LRAHTLSLLCARALAFSLARARASELRMLLSDYFFCGHCTCARTRVRARERERESELRILLSSSTLDILVPEAQS
jgi:hypothetical protein